MIGVALLLLAFALTSLAQGCSRSHKISDETDPVAEGGGFAVDGDLIESDASTAGHSAGSGSDGDRDADTSGDASNGAAGDDALGHSAEAGDGGDTDADTNGNASNGAAGDEAGTSDDSGRDRQADGGAVDSEVVDGCAESQAEITLQGNVVYENYESGPIAIEVFESPSARCTADPQVIVTQTPGDLIGRLELDGPGPFRIAVAITWVNGGRRPEVIIVAIHKRSNETECEGGAAVGLSGVDHDDIEIVMETGLCPILV